MNRKTFDYIIQLISDLITFTSRHEAEFYGIAPLVKRLMLCQDLHHSSCGDVLFCGHLSPPSKLKFINVPACDEMQLTECW